MNTQITTTNQQPDDKISKYLYKDEVMKRFADMLGEKQAQRFVASVLTAVMADPKLQACTTQSIYLAAVRSATLGLSVDPAYGQAYLVPYKGKCTFMPGYKGFRDKAHENGIICHVDEIYANETVLTNRMTGEIRIDGGHGVWRPAATNAWTSGDGHAISGFLATWWSTSNEKEKQYLYMTVERIEEYAETWAPAYKYEDSPWNKNKLSRKEMFKKTVLKILLRKTAPLNPFVSKLLKSYDDDQITAEAEEIDGVEIKGTEEPAPKRSRAEVMAEMGFGTAEKSDNPDPIKDDHWDDWQALCEKADGFGITYPKVVRENTTDTDLAMGFNELMEYVKAAEYQAKAGTEAQ